MNNYYAILGVLPIASDEEIRASFRQLVKRYHPDIKGGNARFFARISEAYETLSEPLKRAEYDRKWSKIGSPTRGGPPPSRKESRSPPNPERKRSFFAGKTQARGARKDRSRNSRASHMPLPMLTRLMSIAVPRSGRFQLQGLIGNIQIAPTTPENLLESTLNKFGSSNPEHLARHVIQIKLSGERDLVRTLMPRPTDFGVEFQRSNEEQKRTKLRAFMENLFGGGSLGGLFTQRPFGLYGAFLPLTLQITVPKGTPLFLRDITGTIVVSGIEGEVVAKMLGGVMKATGVRGANLTLNGSSKAFLSKAGGNIDLMMFGTSKVYLEGEIARLRAVLDNQGCAEIKGNVGELFTEVNGRALLDVKGKVDHAYCDAQDWSRVRIARVESILEVTHSPNARIHVHSDNKRMPIAG